MDKYHQTNPPTELKSAVMGRENSRKGSPASSCSSPTYLIYFEDAEVPCDIYDGQGAEEAARKRFKDASQNWACHLFQKIETNATEQPQLQPK